MGTGQCHIGGDDWRANSRSLSPKCVPGPWCAHVTFTQQLPECLQVKEVPWCAQGTRPQLQLRTGPSPPSSSLVCGPLPPGDGGSGKSPACLHTGPEPAWGYSLFPQEGGTPGRQQWLTCSSCLPFGDTAEKAMETALKEGERPTQSDI